MKRTADREELLTQTIAFWESRGSCTLTQEDAREIVENVTGFVRILLQWESHFTNRSPKRTLFKKEVEK